MPIFDARPEDTVGELIAREAGLFVIRYDKLKEIIRVSGLHLREIPEINRYLVALGDAVADMRRRCGNVRVLADLRESPVRTQAAAECLRLGNLELYQAGDRVALLVESSLLKMQLRRNLIEQYQNIFMSCAAAETWLTAWNRSPAISVAN